MQLQCDLQFIRICAEDKIRNFTPDRTCSTDLCSTKLPSIARQIARLNQVI